MANRLSWQLHYLHVRRWPDQTCPDRDCCACLMRVCWQPRLATTSATSCAGRQGGRCAVHSGPRGNQHDHLSRIRAAGRVPSAAHHRRGVKATAVLSLAWRAPTCYSAVLAALYVHPWAHSAALQCRIAISDSSRLICSCCAGQKPVLKSKQGAFQIVNSVEMFKPLSKFTKQARLPRPRRM